MIKSYKQNNAEETHDKMAIMLNGNNSAKDQH